MPFASSSASTRPAARPRGVTAGKALAAVAVVTCGSLASAATLFTNADPANSFISNAGNWDNGLPTAVNTGTINVNAGYDSTVTHAGYAVSHTAGTLSRSNGFVAFNLGTNTTWVMNGASAQITTTRGMDILGGSQFTLQQGSANLTDNTRDTNVQGAGAALTINGGSMTVGRDLIVRDGGVFTINGGTLTGVDQFFTQIFAATAGAFNFNGGTTTADSFALDKPGTSTFGGNIAGSLELLVGLGTGVTLDWKAGSLMTLTINGANQSFYEGLYTASTLKYEGANTAAFADTFAVSGETLTLIPEPASLALIGLGGLLMLGRGRRDA